MKNIDEKILMAEEEIKQLQNKRKKLITFPNIKEEVNRKILKIIEKRGQSENQNTETQEEVTDIEEQSLVYKGAIIHPKGCVRSPKALSRGHIS